MVKGRNMKLLTLTEQNGMTTRINVPVDGIACGMVQFFGQVIKIGVKLEEAETPAVIDDPKELQRGEFIMKEWQHYGLKPLLVAV